MFHFVQCRRVRAAAILVGATLSFSAAAFSQTRPAGAIAAADRVTLQHALEDYDRGHLQQAEPLLAKLAQKYPASYEINEALGGLYAELDLPDRALAYLQRASKAAPREALAHGNLGAVYLKLGKTDQAVHELQLAASLDPHNAVAEGNLGRALVQAKQPGSAAKAFALALKESPGDPDLTYNLALSLYEGGSNKEAAAALEAVSGAAMTPEMHGLAGDAYERAGDYVKALTHFEAAARLDPSDANLYALTAELLRHWNWAEAIKVADFGTQRYPASVHFKMAAGIAYYGKNDYPPAVAIFSGLLHDDPSNAAVADLLGRSCTALTDGQDAGCQGVYDFAQQHPGNAVMMTYGAVALLHAARENQNLDQAAAMLQAAIAADPGYAEAYLRLGVVEQMRQHWAESATLLEKSIALDPKSPEAHYRLSRAYVRLGRREEAQAQIVLRETYTKQAKDSLDEKMREIMRFVLSPG